MQPRSNPPLIRDYDARYPIHLAAAEGEVVSVEFLIYAHAEINIRDRWGYVLYR